MPNLDIDEQTFEQSFAEMAITSLKSKAPALVDYMMGFQLVERSEDDTRAVGFFGFKIGDNWIYVPVFFLSGEIKGTEMMYVKGQDIFLPLEEGWINYLIQRKPFALGERNTEDRKSRGIGAPDLRRLRMPPGEGKTASWQPWTEGGVAMLEKLAEELPGAPESMSLPSLLANLHLTDGFIAQVRDNPKLAAAVFQFYQPEDFVQAVEKVASQHKTAGFAIEIGIGTSNRVRVFEGSDAIETPEDLGFMSESEKKQLMKGNVVVVDGRTEEKKRKVYDSNLTKNLTNPVDGGVYALLRADGKVGKALILQPRTIGSGGSRDLRLVIDPVSRDYCLAAKSTLYCAKEIIGEKRDEIMNEIGSSVADSEFSSEGYDPYCIIGPHGEAIGPFTVERKMDNQDGSTTLFVRENARLSRTSDKIDEEAGRTQDMPFDRMLFSDDGVTDISQGPKLYGSRDMYWDSGNQRIILTDKPLRKIIQSRGVTMVPRDSAFRVVKLNQTLSAESSPGTTADLYLGVSKLAEDLQVLNDGVEVHFRGEAIQTKVAREAEALRVLMGKFGMAEDSARMIWAEAKANPLRPQHFFVEKKAANFDDPSFNPSFDPELSVPVQQGGVAVNDLLPEGASFDPGAAKQYDHYKDENNAQGMYERDIEAIDGAAATGQKDVFDAAAIGGLINVHDVGAELDSYIPDFIKGLDRLGRTLFLLYWHAEDVQERYGNTEIKTMEDNIKGVFQSLGDAVLDLRKKSPSDEDLLGRGPVG